MPGHGIDSRDRNKRVRETDESRNEYRDLSANLPSRSPQSKRIKKK